MARDGQGLEVSNAGTEAIASLDFLRDEWLCFGNRLGEFIAAADRETSCAMLPVMAASLALSMYSNDSRDAARRLPLPPSLYAETARPAVATPPLDGDAAPLT